MLAQTLASFSAVAVDVANGALIANNVNTSLGPSGPATLYPDFVTLDLAVTATDPSGGIGGFRVFDPATQATVGWGGPIGPGSGRRVTLGPCTQAVSIFAYPKIVPAGYAGVPTGTMSITGALTAWYRSQGDDGRGDAGIVQLSTVPVLLAGPNAIAGFVHPGGAAAVHIKPTGVTNIATCLLKKLAFIGTNQPSNQSYNFGAVAAGNIAVFPIPGSTAELAPGIYFVEATTAADGACEVEILTAAR